MGTGSSYEVKIAALWDLLKDVPLEKRTRPFRLCDRRCTAGRQFLTVKESMDGIFYDRIAGDNGFGYDPVFYLPERGLTTAQLPPDEKNLISHRGKALRAMLAELHNT
jgi:XTP/dITP diphosphohydrolase